MTNPANGLAPDRWPFRLLRMSITMAKRAIVNQSRQLFAALLVGFGIATTDAAAQTGRDQTSTVRTTPYEQHVVFDNSRAVGFYYYSRGQAIAPSALELSHGNLPLATEHVHSPPNSLKLSWTSYSGGLWRADIAARRESGVNVFQGDSLIFWVYSEDGLSADDAPLISVDDRNGGSLPSIRMTGSLKAIPAGQWTRIVLPFAAFRDLYHNTTDTTFNVARLDRISFVQRLDDGKPHTLYIDDIRVGDAQTVSRVTPSVPKQLSATGFERHVELSWEHAPGDVESYRIYRAASPDGPFIEIGTQKGQYDRFEDFVPPDVIRSGQSVSYRITAVDSVGQESPVSKIATAATHPMTDEALLTMVQRGNFRYYWEGAHPNAGMAIEKTPGDPDQVALGASGFGIMALITGVDRNFITRKQGVERLLKITRFLKTADRYHGAWPHFLNGDTGKTMAYFGKYDDGGDLVETAFLMQGLLTARQYFDRNTADERALRAEITELWEGVDWNWYRNGPDDHFLYWHWSPDYGFYIGHPLIGWNETLIVYLLAIASPTHPVPASLWHTGWASQADLAVAYRQRWSKTREGDHFTNGHSYYGIPLSVGEGNGAELFFTQFSFLGFDPRGKHDAYADYFENNRAIARISHAYAVDNPRHYAGYGDDAWGQSAGRHTAGGRARPADDNGTLVVHAALGSMPYTPEESMKALRHYYRDLGAQLWGVYGFSDAFNPTDNWYDEVYMGLDQAQTVAMIENARTGLLWRNFMRNPEIGPALARIGFQFDSNVRN